MGDFTLRYILEGIDKLSIPLKNIVGSSKNTDASLKETTKKLSDLHAKMGTISAYKTQIGQIENLKKELIDEKSILEKLGITLEKDGNQRHKIDYKNQFVKVDTINRAFKKQSDELGNLSTKLKKYGYEETHLVSITDTLVAEEKKLNGVYKSQQIELDKITQKKKLSEARDKGYIAASQTMNVGRQFINFGKRGFDLLRRDEDDVMAFEDVMASTAARAHIAVRGKEYNYLRKNAFDVALSKGVTPTDAAKIQSVIATGSKDIMKEVNASNVVDIINLARGTKSELTTAAGAVKTVIKRFALDMVKDSQSVADDLAYAVNETGTSLEEISETYKSIGGLANSIGIKYNELTPIIGLFGKLGMKGRSATSAVAKTIANFYDMNGKPAQLFQLLGIKRKDESGNYKSWVEILKALAEKLNERDKSGNLIYNPKTKGLKIKEILAGGTKTLPAIDALLDLAGKDGGKGLEKLMYSSKIKGKSGLLANIIYNDTTRGNFEKLEAQQNTLGTIIGETVSPMVKTVTEWSTRLLSLIGQFIERNPNLTKTITVAGVAVSSFAIALGGAIFAGGMMKAIGVMLQFSGAMRLVTGALSLGSLLLSPWVAGLALVGFASYEIYKNLDYLRDMFLGFWDKIKEKWKGTKDWLKAEFQPIEDYANKIASLFKIERPKYWLGTEPKMVDSSMIQTPKKTSSSGDMHFHFGHITMNAYGEEASSKNLAQQFLDQIKDQLKSESKAQMSLMRSGMFDLK